MKNKITAVLLMFVLVGVVFSSCEVWTIKGKKVVIEENDMAYTQATALGAVKIFLTELDNDNLLAASEILLNAKGEMLNAEDKYKKLSELSRLQRFYVNKTIINNSETQEEGLFVIEQELSGGYLMRYKLVKKDEKFYILDYEKRLK